MNYHIMVDEKFIDDFINDAEAAAPTNNIYIINSNATALKFVKNPLARHLPMCSIRFWKTISQINANDKLWIHWLSADAARLMIYLSSSIEVGLFFWGADIVATPSQQYQEFNYDAENLTFILKSRSQKKEKILVFSTAKALLIKAKILAVAAIGGGLRLGISNFKSQLYYSGTSAHKQLKLKAAALKRISYFMGFNSYDLEWIKERFDCNALFVYFFYEVGANSALDQPTITAYAAQKKTFTIWLGNSASTTNNHLDALITLSKLPYDCIEKIISPLNYGDESVDKIYTKTVVELGKKLFKEKFQPLFVYIPRAAYYELLATCDAVFFYHNRSQGAGNIMIALALEKQVFLKKQNTLHQLLTTSDAIQVYSSAGITNEDLQKFDKKIAASNKKSAVQLFDNEIKLKNLSTYLS